MRATGSRWWLRALLTAALGWALLLVGLSVVLPVVTVSSGHDGLQPRVSLVGYYGVRGLLPAAGLLAAVAGAAVLLIARTPLVPSSTLRLAAATAATALVGAACAAAFVLAHLTGLLTTPVAVMLGAALAVASYRHAAPRVSRTVP